MFSFTSAGWQVTLCDPMWHVSSRSGVATLRTAIHLLLTYLLHPVYTTVLQTDYGAVFGYLYILSWLFLGAYVFQNLATGVMVSSYQAIRQQMDERAARMLEAQLQQANVDELVDKVISRTSILA